jgi:hypothetical protein
MRNVSDKRCRGNQYTYFVFNISLSKIVFSRDNVQIYGRVDRRWVTQYNKAHAYYMLDTKATNTDSEYVIIIAFPLQQLWQERASVLRYTSTYVACLVHIKIIALWSVTTYTLVAKYQHFEGTFCLHFRILQIIWR